MRLSQNFYMLAVDFADFDPPLGPSTPAHLPVANIVIGLSCSLKQKHRSLESRGLKALTRPIHACPSTAIGPVIWPQQSFKHPPQSSLLLLGRLATENAKSLQIVIDSPEWPDLRILEDPSIKNREQTYFFTLRFQFDDHLLCDHDALAHSPEAIG